MQAFHPVGPPARRAPRDLDHFVRVAGSLEFLNRRSKRSLKARLFLESTGEKGHRPLRLEATRAFHEDRTRQPIKRREWRPVLEARMALDDRGNSQMTPVSDGPSTAEGPSDLSFDDERIVDRVFERGYFLPSLCRLRSTRRSCDWFMKRFSFCSNSGSLPDRRIGRSS